MATTKKRTQKTAKTQRTPRSPNATATGATYYGDLLQDLRTLRAEVVDEANQRMTAWEPLIHRDVFRGSAENLAHYIAVRRHDLRAVQTRLMPLGLSSIGRLESRALANIDAVIASLAAMTGEQPLPDLPDSEGYFDGQRRLALNTQRLLGGPGCKRACRLMVTLPTEAADNPDFLYRLTRGGMDVARINCAHDGPEIWGRMIQNLRQAELATGRTVRVLADIAGPKLRTSAVQLAAKDTRLKKGDQFLLVEGEFAPAKKWPAQARCGLPGIIAQLDEGQPLWMDDGKLGGRIMRNDGKSAVVDVTFSRDRGFKLKPEKGINLPAANLAIELLDEADLTALDFAANHADIISISFVRDEHDIIRVQHELAARRKDWRHLGLVAKIETPEAVANLPQIIVTAAGQQPFGVMIARGDLAIEIGFEHLAKVQERILWLCEAAHTPVIWATQVLEGLVKEGQPSRSEMTDAMMAVRAECVMLNKGPHIVEAIELLDRLLTDAAEGVYKKSARLRALLDL